jgi:short-subunit dehydrogenase
MIPMKVNIGTAVAAVLARNGADVLMTGHTQEKIDEIRKGLLTQLSPSMRIEGV